MFSHTLKILGISAFKSFTQPVVVEFSDVGGLKYLGGINEVEPRLGANGAGKSSLFDALIWCCYGATARGHKASDVKSWGADRPQVTAFYVTADGHEVAIERMGSPNRLSINDKPSTQEEVDSFLGLTYKRFMQSIVFGQMVPLFIDLPVPARGELLDEVLDLSVWNKAGDVADARSKDLKKTITNQQKKISYYQGIIDSNLPDENLVKLETGWQSDEEAYAENLLNGVARLEASYLDLLPSLDAAKAALKKPIEASPRKAAIQKEIQQVGLARGIAAGDVARAQKEQHFFVDNKTCPTCAQPISEQLRTAKNKELGLVCVNVAHGIEDYDKTYNSLQAEYKKLVEQEDQENKLVTKFIAEFNKIQNEVSSAKGSYETAMENAEKQLQAMQDAVNPYTTQIAARAEAHKQATEMQASHQANVHGLEGELLVADFWKTGFKSVRLYMVKRILAELEIEVGNAASLLGLPGWTIEFKTEVENKSGSIKQGVQVLVRSPAATAAWEVWSGGEGQRIRVAVAIGLSNLIQRMAGVSHNLEVWDEPSAWLSPEGIEDLLDCLAYRAQSTGKSLWLIDPRGLTYANFTEMWRVRKTKYGSVVEPISKDNGNE